MEFKPLGDTLALVLVKTLVKKLINSLEVVKIKKRSYTGSKDRTKNLVETVQDREKKSWRHLVTHLQRWSLIWPS